MLRIQRGAQSIKEENERTNEWDAYCGNKIMDKSDCNELPNCNCFKTTWINPFYFVHSFFHFVIVFICLVHMQSGRLVTYEFVNVVVLPKIDFPANGIIIMKLICRGLWLGPFSIYKLMLEITRHWQTSIQTLTNHQQATHSFPFDWHCSHSV